MRCRADESGRASEGESAREKGSEAGPGGGVAKRVTGGGEHGLAAAAPAHVHVTCICAARVA